MSDGSDAKIRVVYEGGVLGNEEEEPTSDSSYLWE